MIQISVRADFKDVQRKIDALSSDLQRKVVPAALNKVAAKAKTEMTRQIAAEFNIQSSDVRSRLRVTRASRKLSDWYATLDPFASARRGRSLNLIRFVEKSVTLAEARRRKKSGTANQLRFQIKKTGGKQQITGAFIANKGRTVFVRLGNERLPIKALSTIDVPQMFNTRRIASAVVSRIEREMRVEFDRAISAAVAGAFR
jgi:hypothetical protein